MSKLCLILIEIYQRFFSFDSGLLSVFAPFGACRMTPRCSEYAKLQIQEQGVSRGLILAAKRIWSCR